MLSRQAEIIYIKKEDFIEFLVLDLIEFYRSILYLIYVLLIYVV